MKLSKGSSGIGRVFAGPVFLALAFLLAGAVSAEMAPEDSSATSADGSSKLSIEIPDSVSLTLSKPVVELNVATTPSGAFSSDYTVVNVSTSNYTGYTLNFSDEDSDNNLNRIKVSELDDDATISTINATNNPSYNPTTGITSGDMRANAWGYSVGSIDNTGAEPSYTENNYFAVPVLANAKNIKVTGTTSANDETPVFFGTKLDNSTAAGTYQDTVAFSAVANYTPTTTNGITSISPSTFFDFESTTLTIDTDIDYLDSLVDATHPLEVYLVKAGSDPATVACGDVTLLNNNGSLRVTCQTPATGLVEANYNIELIFTKLGNLNYLSNDTVTVQSKLQSFTITALSTTDLSTQGSFYVDTNIDYSKYASRLESPTANTITVGDTDCAGNVTASNNNGNLRYTCATSPKKTVGNYNVKVNLVNSVDSSIVSATASDQVAYAVSTGSGNLSISPNSVAISTTQAVTITTTLTIPTGVIANYGTVRVFIDGNTCTSPSASLSGTTVKVACTAPSLSSTGAKNVGVSIGGYSYSKDTNSIYTVTDACKVGTTTGKRLSDGNCWMTSDLATGITWYYAMGASSTSATSGGSSSTTTAFSVTGHCPSGWYMPTKAQFDTLISKYGSGGTLYTTLGLSSYRGFWSATQLGSGGAYLLYVDGSSAHVTNYGKTGSPSSLAIRCVAP